MKSLKELLAVKIEEWRPRTTRLLKEFGDTVIGEITIEQCIGGMRDVKGLVTDISYLDPAEGIRFRGYTLLEVLDLLPKPEGKEQPYVEGLVYLLLTGDVPTQADVELVVEEFKARRTVPEYVFRLLDAFPEDAHPMSMISAAVVAMQRESEFAKAYEAGVKKLKYWESTYEDYLNLLARMPEIGAYIYRSKYKGGVIIPSDPTLDMGADFAHMMGVDAPYDDVSRLYFIIHSDHESGNASAHAGHLVASTLSDMYYAQSGMLNALAGPLHGLANQEFLRWLHGVMDEMGGEVPTEDQMKEFVLKTLDAGQVIPGFGHAVLRKTDPRFTAQRDFCLKHLPDDKVFAYVNILYKVVPEILLAKGKAKNPWPNVDAQSGVIQWFYGVTEYDFYTVMFGIGRAVGVGANLVWDRALLYSIERPKSLTTDMLEKLAGIK
ncbi:MAG: Citrate synthase [Bacteroidota bacterium]|jgi:citrate synthase